MRGPSIIYIALIVDTHLNITKKSHHFPEKVEWLANKINI